MYYLPMAQHELLCTTLVQLDGVPSQPPFSSPLQHFPLRGDRPRCDRLSTLSLFALGDDVGDQYLNPFQNRDAQTVLTFFQHQL
jgi:hypothetical protein